MKTLKYLIILSFLSVFSAVLKAQNYNPIINYSFNGTPVNGIKIKTNIPFTRGYGMPTIIIEGYNYGDSQPIGLLLNWYVYEDQFLGSAISSFGAYNPEVKLSTENGKVVIFINDRKYYNRFTIRGFAMDKEESPDWFTHWSITDEALSGTKTITLSYKNAVGELKFPGGIISSNGHFGIGTGSPSEKLEINGSIYANTENSFIGIDAAGESRLGIVKKSGYGPVIASGSNYPIIFGSWSTPDIRNNISNGSFKEVLQINTNGNASLEGKLEAREIKVTTTPTADFVFEDHYKLPDLESVEKHIREKKHLPEIASAAEMQKDGVNIGEFQIKLLQKIEELTLYSIEQNKLSKKQSELLRQQQEEIQNLKHEVSSMR
ncbi:hypothetical protein, partial [Elizabethkingia meningoseptica]|uniref:hypothetical protein n=1 Tax=Elizabethkingia meningoseptica TaxID=238 RepID=UPI0021A4ADA0